jgi:predicted transcriptional regulator
MSIRDLDWTEAAPTKEDEEEIQAAIDRGIKDADEGRLFTSEEARERLSRWLIKSATPTPR